MRKAPKSPTSGRNPKAKPAADLGSGFRKRQPTRAKAAVKKIKSGKKTKMKRKGSRY